MLPKLSLLSALILHAQQMVAEDTVISRLIFHCTEIFQHCVLRVYPIMLEAVYVCIQGSESHFLVSLKMDLEIVRKIITAVLIPALCLSYINLRNLVSVTASRLHICTLGNVINRMTMLSLTVKWFWQTKYITFPLTCEEKECFMVPLSRIVPQKSLAALRNKNKDEHQRQHVNTLFAKEYKRRMASINNFVNRPRVFNTHLIARVFDITSTFWVRFSVNMLISTINSKQ